MSLDPNALLIAKRMQAAGYTRGQIAGALGNFQLESGFNPRINEGGKVGAPLGVGGFGVGQWTAGRQKNLINFAKQKGLDPGSVEAQADFLIHELAGPEKRAGESLRGAVSPEEAARRFVTDYERAGIPKTEARQQAARAIYEKLGALDQTPQQTTAQSLIDPQDLLAAFTGDLLLNSPRLQDSVLQLAMKNMSPVQRDVFSAQSLTPVSPYLSALTGSARLPGL
jgi:hypothetical protein